MKTIKKVVLLLLAFVLIMPTLISYATESTLSKVYGEKDYVVVLGNAGEEHIGFDVTLMLVKSSVTDFEEMSEDDIGYIGQTTIDSDGNYLFEFKFSGFAYEKDAVSNYKLLLNVDGKDITPTITKAKAMSELVSFNLDFTNFGRAVANITNSYNLKDLSYLMFVGFYDESGKLLKVIQADKFTGDDNKLTYGYNDAPDETSFAKGFIWENTERIIPLVNSEKLDVAGHTTNREAMMLTIAPGIDETERNFAWYDIPGVTEAKIQYAVKESDIDLVDFPEERAQVAEGTYGEVDVSEYIGLMHGNLSFSHDTDYSWAKATATGLEKGKSYVYRIGDKFGWCKGIYEFKTDGAPDDGFNFLLFADEHAHYNTTGRTGYMIEKAREKALDTVQNTSFIFAIGDNVDYPWFENAYEDYFDREGMTSVPLAAVPGSTHDFMINTPSASLFEYHFNMPNQTDKGYVKNVGANYWYTYGDALFIGIVSHNIPKNKEEIADYIKKASEANPDAKWKIVLVHIPFGIDTEGEGRSPSNYFTEADSDFIADNDIDLVLSAHTHVFARSKPMYSGAITENVVTKNAENEYSVTNPKGVTYINLNTTGMLSGGYGHTVPDYITATDTTALNPYSRNDSYPYGDYYYTYFSGAEIDTSKESETSLKITTYRNSHSLSAPHTIEKTEVVDTYTIVKTN